MADKIVTLEDKNNNNLYPVAGALFQNAVTTASIQDNAVTSDKIDSTTFKKVLFTTNGNVGTKATNITLTDIIDNYTYVEVFWDIDEWAMGSSKAKLESKEGFPKNVILSTVFPYSTGKQGSFRAEVVTFDRLTAVRERMQTVDWSNTGLVNATNSVTFGIREIIGYY